MGNRKKVISGFLICKQVKEIDKNIVVCIDIFIVLAYNKHKYNNSREEKPWEKCLL